MDLECRFETLSPELLIGIATRLPDLESLDNLLRASPAAFRLFDTYGLEIFEAVLSSGLTHEFTCTIIRIVALVRSSALPPQVHDLWSFRSFIRHETTVYRYDPPEWESVPIHMPLDTSATVLRGLLAINRKIVCLTIDCLRYYLDRFKPLRPSHLVDKSFIFVSEWRRGEYLPSWRLKPAETPYPVRDIGPPSWVEEQRVLRAFWRVALFDQLRITVNASLISWPESSVKKLNMMDVVNFYWVSPFNLLSPNELEPNIPLSQQRQALEEELLQSVSYYATENRETINSSTFLQTRRDWPLRTPSQEDWEVVGCHTSWTYTFFYHVSQPDDYVEEGHCTPLQQISFQPFRCLGFAIWDTERMTEYGLLDPSHSHADDSYLLAWRSVLGKEEMAQAERFMMELDDEYWSDFAIVDYIPSPMATDM
ncbi:MAG: hypothetical protein M1818_008496 [Claussenomyces sp. TS43310]|nr:MAG: hypothetical protein M1818_008496 [Claussenomyces sp. TS43310]